MRLIDADDMKTDVINQMAFISLFGGEFAELAEILKKGIVEEIEKAPTIDAVPVVRCKDCKHYNYPYCDKHFDAYPRMRDWFCADGERKDNELDSYLYHSSSTFLLTHTYVELESRL